MLSFTGGNYSPDTYVIEYFKNWSSTASLTLKQFSNSSFITKAKIRQDSSDNNYYVEIYCSSNSNGLNFQVYHQRLSGYFQDTNIVYGGSLTAGSTSGTDYVTEKFFEGYGGITLQEFRSDLYQGDININNGELKFGNTTVITNSRNMHNIGNATFSGSVDVNSDSGQLQFGADNDMQIFHNGANGEINIATGNFTIDSAGDIELNADGGDITFVDGSTEFGRVFGSSNNFYIQSRQSDKDMIFQGNDGGTTVTALTLDMSVGGQLKATPLGVSTPTYAFSNDSNTGMTRPTGDTLQLVTAGQERLRVTDTGQILIGKNTTDNTTAGIRIDGGNKFMSIVRAGNPSLILNRTASDGDILQFRKDGTTIGTIGTDSNSQLVLGSGDTGLSFQSNNNAIIPRNTDGTARDNGISLGNTGARFKDLYLSGQLKTNNSIDLNTGSGSTNAILFFNNSVKNGWIGIPSWDNTSFRAYAPSPVSGNTNEPAFKYGSGAWTFWTDFNNTSGSGSTSTALFISTGGSVNIGRGNLQMNNTTVIDSSRNITGTTITGGQFKWNTDSSGHNYLGSDIYDGLVLHSRPGESIFYGSGETHNSHQGA